MTENLLNLATERGKRFESFVVWLRTRTLFQTGPPEEPTGSTDLMSFYKLTRLHQSISANQPGNFQTQLADVNFSA